MEKCFVTICIVIIFLPMGSAYPAAYEGSIPQLYLGCAFCRAPTGKLPKSYLRMPSGYYDIVNTDVPIDCNIKRLKCKCDNFIRYCREGDDLGQNDNLNPALQRPPFHYKDTTLPEYIITRMCNPLHASMIDSTWRPYCKRMGCYGGAQAMSSDQNSSYKLLFTNDGWVYNGYYKMNGVDYFTMYSIRDEYMNELNTCLNYIGYNYMYVSETWCQGDQNCKKKVRQKMKMALAKQRRRQ